MLEVGGGQNPSSKDLEGCEVGRSWKDEGMRLDTQTLNHLSPRGLVRYIITYIYIYIYIYTYIWLIFDLYDIFLPLTSHLDLLFLEL